MGKRKGIPTWEKDDDVIILDSISDDEIKSKKKRLNLQLKKKIFLVSCIEFLLIIFTISTVIIWWYQGFIWTIFSRLFGQLRFIFLFISLALRIPVVNMLGNGKYTGIMKSLSIIPPLGIWELIGIVDLLFLRIPLFFVDLIYLATTGTFVSIRTLVYLILGLSLILEFFVSNYVIYYVVDNNMV